jgi:acyl carrier protein
MADSLEHQIIEVIQGALRNNGAEQDVVVTGDDSMETIAAWDSLTFMSVFLTVNEVFGLNPDFDDAIHYTSVKSLHTYLQEKLA